MRRRTISVFATLGVVAALMVATPANAHGGRPFSARLIGSSEVPGPGDLDGSGTASLRVNHGRGQVCFEIHVSGIGLPATAAHIHQGATGVAGPIIVSLAPPGANGVSSGCVSAAKAIVKAITKDPANYYVNVHTSDFPNGALRGQLTNGSGHSDEEGSDILSTTLSGANEVPGPGDPDGAGTAFVALIPDRNQMCFIIVVTGITRPGIAAHIHQGGSGVAGPVVVTLSPPDASGATAGCVSGLSHDLVTAIGANPGNYYVNVHTTDYPNGAIRGQLSGNHHDCHGDGDDLGAARRSSQGGCGDEDDQGDDD
jgi:hypothetical protein